jgi:riboflavin kinase/FMN adenylyltransferase
VLTIGNFDGVHRGHQRLIDHLQAQSQKMQLPTTLMTFEPQPREFFAGAVLPARLTRFREKVHLLERTGLDRLLCVPFNEQTSQIPAEWFAEEFLTELVGAQYVVIGDDFRFGHARKGDFQLLQNTGARLGYEVISVDTVLQGGDRVSSTLVRSTLSAGDFAKAAELLGHEYFIMGRVVYGRQLGRQLGVPTANVKLQRYRAALQGVYCVTVDGVTEDDRSVQGIANIGVRPTVDGKEPLLEVHVFDFSGDVYGRRIRVTFKHKLRDEQTFASVDLLKQQIDADLLSARRWFAESASVLD